MCIIPRFSDKNAQRQMTSKRRRIYVYGRGDVASTSIRRHLDHVLALVRRHHVASTSIRRHFDVMCPLDVNPDRTA